MSESYVYIYLDPRKPGTFNYGDLQFEYMPFYVGKGYGLRAYEHLKEKRMCNPHKSRKINSIIKNGLLPIILFLKTGLMDEDAQKYEIECIAMIGRHPLGPLLNLTDGGDGSAGFKRSKESIDKQRISLFNNKEWLDKMSSEEFAKNTSDNMKKFYSDDKNKEAISKRQRGELNSMYGKETSRNQKDAVRKAFKDGRWKLTDEGRQKIIESGQNRKGKKNSIQRFDVVTYLLIIDSIEHEIKGAKALQNFCKLNKLQYHVLKNNLDIIISEDMVEGTKIYAKNTIGCKLQRI